MQARSGEHATRHLYLAIRRRGAALGDAGTQFNTVGTAFLRCQTALYAVGADFKSIFLFHNYLIGGLAWLVQQRLLHPLRRVWHPCHTQATNLHP